MPFADAVSNVSGRNSRSSNVSAITASTRFQSRPNPPADTLASAGVLSMLKTSTDTGDIGALSFNHARLPAMSKLAHHRKERHHGRKGSGGSLPTAAPSLNYAPSQASKVSSTREWDSTSNHGRGSFTSMQSMPPTLGPGQSGKEVFGGQSNARDGPRDARSYSLSSTVATQPLPRHRSQTSLKSQGHGTRPNGQLRPPPPPGQLHPAMMDGRPPYVYPTRLRRPGYRSASPALSDTYAMGAAYPPGAPVPNGQPGVAPGGPPMATQYAPGMRRMPMPPGTRPPPRVYNGEYPADYNPAPHYQMNVRPPPRMMSSSPIPPTTEYGEPIQYPYRNPMAARSAPGVAMPQHPHPRPIPPPQQQQMMQQRPAYPPQQVPSMPFPPRAGAPTHATGHRLMPNHMRGPHPSQLHPRMPPQSSPEVAPMVHQIFHNAARMSRHIPQRTETPMTDLSPPSSDPPSSSTAPTSSSPPTPRDQTSIHVTVDPAFIDPALGDLHDSTSEPVLPHQYLQYADALEKELDEQEIVVAHPSVPPSGFVQRVRAMLESKGMDNTPVKRSDPHVHLIVNTASTKSEQQDEAVHELAANETPQATMLDGVEAPAELPASPVIKIAELADSSVQPKRRITREMVKAQLGPSDTPDNTTSIHIEPGESTNIDMIIEHMRNCSREEALLRAAEAEQNEDQNQHFPLTPDSIERKENKRTSQESNRGSSHEAQESSEQSNGGARSSDHSTAFSNETQSRDPFLLDADTITLQRRKHKKQSVTAMTPKSRDLLDVTNPDMNAGRRDTVSPLRFGERVVRDSAVSPLQTQTLGIDETMIASSDTGEPDTTSSSENVTSTRDNTMPGAFPDDSPPPASPRKAHSKSVQLQPQPRTTLSNAPSGNRASLPPDFSSVADDTLNSTMTDMVTDVAFRFSLPQTTITVNKPQIIEIPPSSSPEQHTEPVYGPGLQPTASKSKRNSVRFDDEISPLKINKKSDAQASANVTSENSAVRGPTLGRRSPPLQTLSEQSRLSHDSTTDLRFSGANGGFGRFGSTHLPGLKEESTEDMSVSDKRAPYGDLDSEFPLPARIAAVKAMQERRLQEAAEKAKARRAHRHWNQPLADSRDLPSLNFSRMDLIDKLNEALEVRSSKSMDVMRGRELSGIYCPSPQRPQSTEPLRERYMSFFSKPEDFSTFIDDTQDESEVTEEKIQFPDDSLRGRALSQYVVPTVEVEPNTETETTDGPERGLSPEDFLHVATQVNRLSIPSVSGLSDRLSELLPNLRELQLDSILAGFAEDNPDLPRPETALSNRTSAGFRTLAERAEEIVKNGTHDSTGRKDIPFLLDSMTAPDGKRSGYLSGSASAPSELGKIMQRPASALARSRAPTTAEEVFELLPPEMNPITRDPRRALISSGSSRPWDQDENYPWAGTMVDVDLNVPSRPHTHHSAMSDTTRLRKTKSLDFTSSPFRTKGADIGSIIDHDQSNALTLEKLTGVSNEPKHKLSKLSVIGSLTRKIGFTYSNTDSTGILSTNGPGSDSASPRAHRPGERYPTSGLIQPSALNLDEVRSFFSDESTEEKHRHGSLRKRLTQLKPKGKNARLDSSRCQSRSHSLDATTTAYDAASTTNNMTRIGLHSPAHTNNEGGVGMSKTEFHIKRFGEKLRLLVAKGSQLLRSWSQRSHVRGTAAARSERLREDWLSDSVYSGV